MRNRNAVQDGGGPLTIVVGSANPVKIAAVTAVFRRVYLDAVDVAPVSTASGVSRQPWGNEETLRGALNRAHAALETGVARMSVGLEGGLLAVGGHAFTCAWCAIARDDGLVGHRRWRERAPPAICGVGRAGRGGAGTGDGRADGSA